MTIQAVVQSGVSGSAPVGWSFQRSLARKSNGELWFAYSRNLSTNKHRTCVAYSRDDGLTWTEDKVFDLDETYSNYPSTYPVIAIDGLDDIHLAWGETHAPNGDGWGNLIYCKRTSAGWGSPEWITDEERSNGALFSTAIDSNNDFHIVWQRSPVQLGPRQIYYRKRASGVWGTQEALTDKTEHQEWPSMAIDSNDDVHVVWAGLDWGTNTTYYNIQYRKRTSAGWQAQEAITDKNANQLIVCIAVDSSDQPHVAWHGLGWGTNNTMRNIQYRMRTTSWQTQETITDKDNEQRQPSIAIDGSDNVHCVWWGLGWGTNTTKTNLQYNKRTTSWGSQVAITDRNHDQMDAKLIWAPHPTTVGGQKSNLPDDGFALVWFVDNDPTFQVEFYSSSDLAWDYIQLLVKYASGQAKEVFT